MKNKVLTLSVIASLVLTACGGGGGGSGSSTVPAAGSASTPTAASAPAAASTPAATPTVAGEQLPSLSSPQPGSTAATNSGVMGIWSSTSGAEKTTAFIDSQNNLSFLNVDGIATLDEFFGVISPVAPAWTLTSGGQFSPGFLYSAATPGSGTFTANQSFTGSYVDNGNTFNIAWTYDPANALAVSQSTVAGTWSENNASLTITSSGAVTGTISNCSVTGTMMLANPGSSQNLYVLSLTTGADTSCSTQNVTLSGNSAIVFLPIQNSTLYQRTILYALHTPTNSAVAYGQLSLQQQQ
jgi:hypothetical protein